MQELIDYIKEYGTVLPHDVLKVDAFLNHQVNAQLMKHVGEEFAKRFAGEKIDHVWTVESSGIAPALMTALALDVPMIFARKHQSLTLKHDMYTAKAYSYTKQTTNNISISKKYVTPGENVLLVDDFMANGQAANGMLEIAKAAGVHVVGVGIVIEKSFQPGGKKLREQGLRVDSLAKIKSLADGKVSFVEE